MLNPSTVTLLAAGVQQAVSMSAQVVFDSFLKKNVCRLTISYSSLPRGVTCTVSLSPAIKTTDGRTLDGGYSFVFYTVSQPHFVNYGPGQNAIAAPVSYVTLTASENIDYSTATVTVGGTAMSASTTLNSSDLSVTGNVLKIRMPDACFAWSDAGSGSLKTVQVSVSGVTAALDGAILPDTVLDYNLERAWQDVGAFDATPPITGGNTARTVQLAATATHLYLAHMLSDKVYLRRYNLSTKMWEDPPDSWSNNKGVFSLTADATEAFLLREFDDTVFINVHGGFSASHVPQPGVTPTSLDAVAAGGMLWYVFNSAVAGYNCLQTWLYDFTPSPFHQIKNHSPYGINHTSPTIALNGSNPWVVYVDNGMMNNWDVVNATNATSVASVYPDNAVLRHMYVNGAGVLLGGISSVPWLKVSKVWPYSSQVSLYRMPDSAQADACVMDGTTPVFMYPMGPIGTYSLVCDGWYDGMSDMRPLATQSPDVSAHRADWSVVATGVSLGARPAIVATPDAVFAAWYDSTQNKVFVRRHDGR